MEQLILDYFHDGWPGAALFVVGVVILYFLKTAVNTLRISNQDLRDDVTRR